MLFDFHGTKTLWAALLKSQQRVRWKETPLGKGRSETEISFWRRAESQAGKARCMETVEGEEEWGESGEDRCQEAKAEHRAGLRAAVEPCQRRSCLAGPERRGDGCAAVGVCGGEPGQAAARWGRRGRAGGCSDFQAGDYFTESSEVQSYVCLLSAVTLSLFNVVLTAACFYKSK